MELVNVIGTTAFIFSFVIASSPFPALYEGIKTMKLTNITFEYVLLGCVQSAIWALYGHKLDDFYAYFTNDICGTIFFIYINMYMYINRMNDKMLLLNGGIIAVIILCYSILSGKLCLIVASTLGTTWQFSMIRTMKKALESKDASFINLPIACLSFCGLAMWALYAVLTNNPIMFIPNILGVIMFGINLLIYAWTRLFLNHDNIIIQILQKVFFVSKDSPKDTPQQTPLLNSLRSTSNDV